MTYRNFGRTSQIRTGDLYHVKASVTRRSSDTTFFLSQLPEFTQGWLALWSAKTFFLSTKIKISVDMTRYGDLVGVLLVLLPQAPVSITQLFVGEQIMISDPAIAIRGVFFQGGSDSCFPIWP